MNLLLAIARFDVRYNLRQLNFFLFAALVFGQGVWYTYRLDDSYLSNSPIQQTYTLLSSLGLVLAAVTVLITSQALSKDWEFRTAAYLYTLPITPRIYFAGRFIGSLVSALLLAAFYPLGIVFTLAVFSTSSEPIAWLALLDGLIWLTVPNVFISVCITFSLTVLLRSVWGSYSFLFLIVLYFLLTESQVLADARWDIWQLLDPFAVGMIRDSIDKLRFFSGSDSLLSFSDSLIINRILWLGIPMGLLARAERFFSFDTFNTQSSHQAPPNQLSADVHTSTATTFVRLPSVKTQFTGQLYCQTILHLTKLNFQTLVRHPIVQLTSGLLILLTLLLATAYNLNPDFPELPVTARMTALRLPMGFFIGLFLLVMTGELLYQERTVGFWPIFETLPQPNFVLLLSKILPLIVVAALLTGLLFLTGVGLQIFNGFYEIDWALYRADLLTDGFLRYCQVIFLGAWIAVLLNNRLASHLINVVLFSLLTVLYQVSDPAWQRYLYSFLPGSTTYSAIVGYGIQAPIRSALPFIWWGFAVWFLVLFLLTWSRGISDRLADRFRQFHEQFTPLYLVPILGSFVLMGIGFWLLAHPLRVSPEPISQYHTQTTGVRSVSGRRILVTITYQHPYQVRQMLRAAQTALREGEQLFGVYPYRRLQIHEVPTGQVDIASKPEQLFISETQGWLADYRKPYQLDHIDYLIATEVFRQWLVHHMQPVRRPGDGFIRQSLAGYLALQLVVARHYGPERLKYRLSQRKRVYGKERNRQIEISVLQSSGNHALEHGRAVLALSSIGQVCGDTLLRLTIGQFYKQALHTPGNSTTIAFARQLTDRLPDSLKYLTTYLTTPLWFDLRISRLSALPNGLTVEVIATKWRADTANSPHVLPINDYIPIAVLDQNGREIYRQLAHPNPDKPLVSLPVLPTARSVVIDPMGTWIEEAIYDNRKLF